MAYTTIDDPEAYFQVKAYTGTGSTLSVTLDGDTDMQPDAVWLNCRSLSKNRYLFDAVRGATEHINPNDTDAEGTDANTLTSFNSDGFTVGTSGAVNTSSATFVSWNWKANGTGSSDTNGSINSTKTSANTTSGFSIVTYTGDANAGATVGHGLGAIPDVMLVKNRTDGDNWSTFHNTSNMGNGKFLKLDDTAAVTTETTIWNDTSPTSSLFSVGTHNRVNGSGDSLVAYLWTGIQGFSKFGSYTGNGNADGVFIFLGFKPAFLIIKRVDGVNNWKATDHKRDPHNLVTATMNLDSNGAEGTEDHVDYLANGFKIKRNGNDINNDGGSYIFMAWAEAPFVNSEGVPCNAR